MSQPENKKYKRYIKFTKYPIPLETACHYADLLFCRIKTPNYYDEFFKMFLYTIYINCFSTKLPI